MLCEHLRALLVKRVLLDLVLNGLLLNLHAGVGVGVVNLRQSTLIAAECGLRVLRQRAARAFLLAVLDAALHGVIYAWHEKLSDLTHAQIPEKSFCWARLPYSLAPVLAASVEKFDHALADP